MTADRDAVAVAVGVYLQRRARRKGLTDEQVAAAIRKGLATVGRIHAGTVEMSGIALLRYLRLVGGDLTHLFVLLDDPTVARAHELAERDSGPDLATWRLATRISEAAASDPTLAAAVEGFIAGRLSRIAPR